MQAKGAAQYTAVVTRISSVSSSSCDVIRMDEGFLMNGGVRKAKPVVDSSSR